MAILQSLPQATPANVKTGFGGEILFTLAPGWAVGADSLQWLLLQAVTRQAGDHRQPWRVVAFVATSREVLERVINERGIPVSPDGRARLDALPGSFPRTVDNG